MTADKIVEIQVALANHAMSPGSIDGLMGSQTRAAVRAFQESQSLPATGNLDETTLARLAWDGPLYTNYVVTAEDVDRLTPLSSTWLGKSQQPRLDYETVLELVSEKTFSHPNLIKRLNPSVSWTNASVGTEVKVPLAQLPEPAIKAALLRIRLSQRTLQVFGADSNLLAHFPCSIAQRVEKRPVGESLQIVTVAPDPNYTFDPAVFPESAEARELGRKLILQPGPNNPVGVVWIGLDKPGYGIHGTPRPEDVGRTESHGCFRLANWNARYLLQFVSIGTTVEVLP
jgi:lipoprotein-anchoring transpeptidase ErfK/SrfK